MERTQSGPDWSETEIIRADLAEATSRVVALRMKLKQLPVIDNTTMEVCLIMSNNNPKPPKRLRLKPHCFIEGVRTVGGEQRRLAPGLYVLGKNMTEAEAIRLSQPDMAHVVQVLEDERKEEELADDIAAPKPDPSFDYIEKKRAEAESARAERWQLKHGRTILPNEGDSK